MGGGMMPFGGGGGAGRRAPQTAPYVDPTRDPRYWAGRAAAGGEFGAAPMAAPQPARATRGGGGGGMFGMPFGGGGMPFGGGGMPFGGGGGGFGGMLPFGGGGGGGGGGMFGGMMPFGGGGGGGEGGEGGGGPFGGAVGPGQMFGGTTSEGLVGGILEPLLGSTEQRFYPAQYTQTQPWQHLPFEAGFLQSTMFRPEYLAGQRTPVPTLPGPGPTFQAPGAQQRRALAGLEAGGRAAIPAFEAGVGRIAGTARGEFLDPMQRPEFARMSQARQDLARQMFGESMADVNARAAARGIYGSSAREAQVGREAGRIGTQAAQDIAQAGWQQYQAERQAQEAAARAGVPIAPGLAEQVFRGAETTRAAEQQARQYQQAQQTQRMMAQLDAQMRAAGIDAQTRAQRMDDLLQYMRLAQGTALPWPGGESEQAATMSTVTDLAEIAGKFAGGM
jgi:hypothetical protein